MSGPPTSQWPDPHGFRPVPGGSLRPKPRSIFTLRPVYHTEQPPPEIEGPVPPTPDGPKRPPRRWLLLGAIAIAVAGAGALLWPHAHAPARSVVLVNGASKPKQTPNGSEERWANGEVTVVIDTAFDELGPGARDAVQTAFGTWVGSGARLPNLRFDSASQLKATVGQDGVSSVVFAPIDVPGHSHDLAITIGYADSTTGRLIEADVIVSSEKPFAVVPSQPAGNDETSPGSDHDETGEAQGCHGVYDLQDVVTHEAGHFFGLDEDLEDHEATMFYKTGKCELVKRDLSPPDLSVVSTLYSRPMAAGPENDTGAGCGGASIAGNRGTTGSAPFSLLALVLSWVAHRSRRVRRGQDSRIGHSRASARAHGHRAAAD